MKGSKLVFNVPEGISFDVRKGKRGTIIIDILKQKPGNNCIENYKKPPIPKGYRYVMGDWKTGFVIQSISDKSEFVWVPVGWLEANGTLDGIHFTERYGRRRWKNEIFSLNDYHENVNLELLESIRKYGGFYYPRFHASLYEGKLVFLRNKMPLVNVNENQSEMYARNYTIGSKSLGSCLTTGAAFDCIVQWILQLGEKTLSEIVIDSTEIGNYINSNNSPGKVVPTGSNENWCVCNIYDLAGNVDEWTSEQYDSAWRVLRGACCPFNGDVWPVCRRNYVVPSDGYSGTSFRLLLYVE